MTGFQCLVNARGGGSCELSVGPLGFDMELAQGEIVTFQHSFHLLTGASVPEPSTLALLAAGAALAAIGRRRAR